MGSKNVGQVAGMHVSTTPPENIKMIWWDSTPSQLCHKIYDSKLKQWVILNQGILSTITYNELKNLALSVGLSVGKFYVITDKGNILALSITRTKVQYVDLSGNLLVDDLGTNTTYYVSSNNLTIDGENGVFNQDSTKLNFNFTEAVPNIDTAYIYGKDRTSSSSSVMRLIKFKMSSLISSVTGNALTWNSGLYFNFSDTLLTLGDKKGGVVLFDTYSKDKEVQDQSIENIANNYNALVSQVNSLIKEATSDANILNKRITALETGGEPIDAAAGDTIYTVLSKFQRYINKFKYATGIRLSQKFSAISSSGKVNNNDTVETAIAKLQNSQSAIQLSLPKDWKPSDTTEQPLNAGDEYSVAFGKIEADRKKLRDMNTAWKKANLSVDIYGLELGFSGESLQGLKFSDETTAFLNWRIKNGVLELNIPKPMLSEWVYSRTIVYDNYRVAYIDSADLANAVKERFAGSDVIPIVVCNLGMSSTSKDISASSLDEVDNIVFVTQLLYSNGRVFLGISPINAFSVSNDGAIALKEVNNGVSTIQSCCSSANVFVSIAPFTSQFNLL